ncbi:tryptophan 7-halogenase [Sphingomonas piscis]|uniref:Tryptophan 7-halogenase n=1 Tax=Sphingomonas piscis TaxID=2714943 RepID=A0A6G7YN68_9SPHN|nr:tryptophan halogenase family protein [Sphingomonas piscis]QIK78166.1 tryptophan 7-halogenase [Sphingomonas piscis]
MSSAPIFNVLIVGGGTAGWMAAAGLRRILPEQDYAIRLVESEQIGTVGVGEATLPHIKLFNDMLGLDEAEFMAETGATFKLGIEFGDWLRTGHSYIHPFGAFGEPWAGVDFQHHWLRAQHCDVAVRPLQDYSLAVRLAREDRFGFPAGEHGNIGSTFSYAYHFDAGRYAAYLRRWCVDRGVERVEGRITGVHRNGGSGDIAAVRLESGIELEADLFIDCSGFRSMLLDQTLGIAWEDWAHWLPCDSALAVPCASGGELTPYTRSTAKAGGWIWRIPLQHRTGNGYVFASSFLPPDRAAEALLEQLDGETDADPKLLRFAAGRRALAWKNNCVAIGLSSGFLEPLESTSIYLIQAAIMDLLKLFPRRGSTADPRLAAEYNRLFGMHYDRVRDFLVLHYVANDRVGEPLWDYLRAMPLPDTLRHKIDLFRSRGTTPDYELGLFSKDSWLAVLAGQGIVAERYDRCADAMGPRQLEQRLRDLEARLDRCVSSHADHGTFVARYCAEPYRQEVA